MTDRKEFKDNFKAGLASVVLPLSLGVLVVQDLFFEANLRWWQYLVGPIAVVVLRLLIAEPILNLVLLVTPAYLSSVLKHTFSSIPNVDGLSGIPRSLQSFSKDAVALTGAAFGLIEILWFMLLIFFFQGFTVEAGSLASGLQKGFLIIAAGLLAPFVIPPALFRIAMEMNFRRRVALSDAKVEEPVTD